MNIHTNNGIHPLAPHSSNESVADESDSEIPELIDTPDDEGVANMENIPQMNGITYNLGPDLESDEEEFMGQSHSIAPSNCPYCNNCHPHVVVESFVDFCGEPFTRNRLICQSTWVGSSPSVRAMSMVHSSNVQRRQTVLIGQPDRSPRLQATLAAEVEINGLKALVLFDSRSTTDLITPEFAFATKANQFRLEEQVVLQLGCVGS